MRPFSLERYFDTYEFSAPYLLCSSDLESLSMKELLLTATDDAKRLWEELSLGYTHAKGHPQLLEEIESLYQYISTEDLLVTAPEEGIYLAMKTLIRKGDHMVVTFPGYQSLYEIAASSGCIIDRWSPVAHEFRIEDLKRLIRDDTKMIVINFPHNPTGASVSKETLSQIVSIAEEYGCYLFSDEMYRFLEFDPKDRLPAACDLYAKAISLSGMSKSFSLPGLRIGWLASRDHELIQRCASYKDYTTLCSSAPSEILALMGLQAREDILKRNMTLLSKNLDLLKRFFSEFEGLFSWDEPIAGPISFPKILFEKSSDEFCEELREKRGVLLLPSSCYEYGDSHFRISCARENMPSALELLYEYMREEFS